MNLIFYVYIKISFFLIVFKNEYPKIIYTESFNKNYKVSEWTKL